MPKRSEKVFGKFGLVAPRISLGAVNFPWPRHAG